jgi:2'-5' RNA ligase
VRLFSALWPPEPAIAHLATALRSVVLPPGVRSTPIAKWHVTLAFYGNDADATERAGLLDERLAGTAAPTLRLVGAGTFPGVLWVGVEPVPPAGRGQLKALATAAGAGDRFHPHVTVARWRFDRSGTRLAAQLARYRGPTWTADAVTLVRSDLGADYTTVHSVPLIAW